jgi:type I restriction enzyme R subunit
MQRGQPKQVQNDLNRRGGIIWHTQGSGKSYTMVFLIRFMRTLPSLQTYKVVLVTDRRDLQKQLSDTMQLVGQKPHIVEKISDLRTRLAIDGPELVFAMIQKYQDANPGQKADPPTELKQKWEPINTSPHILVIVDEAHRSQSNTLNSHLDDALPNSVRIAFTGTPIMIGDELKHTTEIFGTFIDTYTIRESEADGATLPIMYEGRRVETSIKDQKLLDQTFADMFQDYSLEEQEEIKDRYVTIAGILESEDLIAQKAKNILEHYVDVVLPDGFKAMVVGTTRRAAARYKHYLKLAQIELLAKLSVPDFSIIAGDEDELRFLERARKQRERLVSLDFALVCTPEEAKDPNKHDLKQELDEAVKDQPALDDLIEAFRKPFTVEQPKHIAILCVQGMLLTGFDAPIAQTLYLDRFMRRHTLLQAIARVNRTYHAKKCGFVVDYIGLASFVREALNVYRSNDVQGALVNWRDELPKLHDRYLRTEAIFTSHQLTLNDTEQCVNLLRDSEIRADFTLKLKKVLSSLDIVLPRREALEYVPRIQRLSLINKLASGLYRDKQLNFNGAGEKVRHLLDEFLQTQGISISTPAIAINDPTFDTVVDQFQTDEAQAAEMEHAARDFINEHLAEDPVYYKTLSARLNRILDDYKNNWHDLASRLRSFVQDVRKEPPSEPGLDGRTQTPFYRVLKSEINGENDIEDQKRDLLIRCTLELTPLIKEEIKIPDFWRHSHANDQNRLKSRIMKLLLKYHVSSDTSLLERIASHTLQVAMALHTRLIQHE